MKTVNELIAEFQTNVHTNLDSPNRGSVFTIEASVGSSCVSVPIAYCNSYAEAFGTFFERCIEDIEGQVIDVKREMDDYEIDVDDEDFDDWLESLEEELDVLRTDLDTANEAAAEIEEGDENVRKLLVIG